jgi:DNA-binding NtrC family response regulator
VARYCAANGLPLDAKVFSDDAVALISYHWPGNIRELESTVSRAALSAPGRVIRDGDIEFLHAHTPCRAAADGRSCRRCATPSAPTSSACSSRVVEQEGGARVLEISRGTLSRKILEYQLEQDGRRRARRDHRVNGNRAVFAPKFVGGVPIHAHGR